MPGYRRIPDVVTARIAECPTDTFYVGVTRTYRREDVADGALTSLGISLDDNGQLHVEPEVLPSPTRGRWSGWNIHGRRIVRKDLPKVDKTYSHDVPIFGDYSRGTATVHQTRSVFQRQDLHGQNLTLLVDVAPSGMEATSAPVAEKIVVGFRVNRVFDRTHLGPAHELLMALSLLRENTGSADVVSTGRSAQDWLSEQQVQWEFLPVDHEGIASFETVAARLKVDPSSPRGRVLQNRYEAVRRLHPPAVVLGSGGFTRYIAFKFRDDLVALENLEYGNALYLMYGQWPELSQRTRLQLLAEPDAGYDRIRHTEGWETKLRHMLVRNGHDPEAQEGGPAIPPPGS